jgi:TatD DNase family protein
MRLFDSHCHPLSLIKRGHVESWLKEIKSAGLEGVIAIGTDLEDWTEYRNLAQNFPEFIYYTVGLHPGYVTEGWEETIAAISPYFADTKSPVALGEIGLDYYRLPDDPAEAEKIKHWQKGAFKQQLSLAYQLGCPIVIHSRHAFHDCVKMIDESHVDWKKVVFHCFTEGPECVKELNHRGGRASFTGVITYPNAPIVTAALKAQGLSRLMLETDAPYLTPQSKRGQENSSAYIGEIAVKAAEIMNLPADEVAEVATMNSRHFFGI